MKSVLLIQTDRQTDREGVEEREREREREREIGRQPDSDERQASTARSRLRPRAAGERSPPRPESQADRSRQSTVASFLTSRRRGGGGEAGEGPLDEARKRPP